MRPLRWLFAIALLAATATSASAENKRLLLVTDSGGFIHDSVGLAEQILKDIGPKNGIDVTCYRFTRDPDQMIKVRRKENQKTVEVDTTVLVEYAEKFRRTTGVAVEKDSMRPGERGDLEEVRLRALLHDRQSAGTTTR